MHNKGKAPGATGEVVLVPAIAQSVQALAVGQMRSVGPIPPFLDKARASLARNTQQEALSAIFKLALGRDRQE